MANDVNDDEAINAAESVERIRESLGGYAIVHANDQLCFALVEAGQYFRDLRETQDAVPELMAALPEEVTAGRTDMATMYVRNGVVIYDRFDGRDGHHAGVFEVDPTGVAEAVAQFPFTGNADLRLLLVDKRQGIPDGLEAGLRKATDDMQHPEYMERATEFLQQ